MPIIGAHVSTAGGLHNCFANAQKIGAECLQIFVANPQQFKARDLTAAEVDLFKSEWKKSKLGPVFAHASYLVNLASPDNKVRFGGLNNLIGHFKIAAALKLQGLIFHLGAAKGGDRAEAIVRMAEMMKKALAAVSGSAPLILENTAGGGTKLGASPEEFGEICRKVKSNRVKICLDTAHMFEAGWLCRFDKKELDEFVRRCDSAFGWAKVAALHINDSATACGSHHDRHENIGEGKIGLAGFQQLAVHPKFNKLPWILEVPGFSGEGPDKKNVRILKELFNKQSKQSKQ